MKDEYYTPVIEEFHVGFEFEYLNKDFSDTDWVKTIFDPETCSGYLWKTEDFTELIEKYLVRVKYLESKGIEELGWEILGSDWYNLISVSGELGYFNYVRLKLFGKNSFIKGYRANPITSPKTEQEYLFQGEIKNKSELKKLMKQLSLA